MNEKKEQQPTDWSTWFPTYGVLTAERIFERFNIKLSHDELVNSVNDPQSLYFQLLRVPLKNVFNGIILRQAHDYQIYAQKLLVDYLLSGEDSKDNTAPGAATREDVEMERIKLIETGEAFRTIEEAHQLLIAESQTTLVDLTRDLTALRLAPQTLDHRMTDFLERAENNNINLRSYRSQFYNLILRITEFLRLITDYHIDQAKIEQNRASLEFDALIGDA